MKLALPAVLAGVALLCAAAASARGMADQAMAVTVDGPGTVTSSPAGINCRDDPATDCVELWPDGTSVTLTAIPDPGATFTGWSGFGACSGTSTTCTVAMNSAQAISATFTSGGGGGGGGGGTAALSVNVTGPGTVTGQGISCGNGATDCSETYTTGTVVTLTATPASGQTFSGWGGACSGASSTCTVTMSASQSVTATFASSGSTTTTLTVSVTGNGKVTGSGINCGLGSTDCSETYAVNTVVTLTATPATGAAFSAWGGSCTGSAATCTVTMTASKAVTATFTGGSTQTTLTVTVTGSGRVVGPGIDCGQSNTDCSEVYAANTTVTLAEIPASGANFAGWGSSCSGSGTTCTVTMSASKSVTAAFTQISTQKILTVTVGGSGRVSGPGISCGTATHDCSNAFDDGTLVTIRATPAAGAIFIGWGGACTGTQVTCTVRMDAPRAVSASFSQPNARPAGFTARSLGDPIVARTSVGWAVSLRFFTSRPASALLRLSLNGRLLNAFTFSPHAGTVTVGPFNVARPGTYTFRLTLSDSTGNVQEIIWSTCLSDNGCGTYRPAASFISPRPVTATRVAGGWIVHVRFQASTSGVATVRMSRGGSTVTAGSFSFHRGAVLINLPARQAGLHSIVLTARSATGRTMRITWNALLT